MKVHNNRITKSSSHWERINEDLCTKVYYFIQELRSSKTVCKGCKNRSSDFIRAKIWLNKIFSSARIWSMQTTEVYVQPIIHLDLERVEGIIGNRKSQETNTVDYNCEIMFYDMKWFGNFFMIRWPTIVKEGVKKPLGTNAGSHIWEILVKEKWSGFLVTWMFELL